MFKFHILTIFPEMFASFCSTSICKRAIDAGKIGIVLHNFRDYTLDKHRRAAERVRLLRRGAGISAGKTGVQHLYVGFGHAVYAADRPGARGV